MNPDDIPPDAFDELVRNALDQLPDEAAALVAHIAVVVREQPEPDEVKPGQLLLGTFRGSPTPGPGVACRDRCPTSSRCTGCRS